MAIIVKSEDAINKMRASGKLVARVHDAVATNIREGITTAEIDRIIDESILSQGAKSSSKGYKGFPGCACISVNEEVIHGIPGSRKLKNGDIVGVDISAYINGYHGDATRTYMIGDVSDEARQLVERTQQSFFEGIKYAKEGCRLYEISEAIFNYISGFGYTAVQEFCGHGIGKKLHEDPQVPNYKQRVRGPRLVKGITLAIEPMINVGTEKINILENKWTVVTADGKLSAHYENTVLVTDGEPEILTLF